MAKAPATQPAVQAGLAGPEIREPTLTQQLLLDVPFGDDIAVISARGTGKSWGIALLVARDAAHFKEKYACLITRTTYQGLTELQGLLWRYLVQVFPGTTYSGSDMTFRLGGKLMPYGKVELAYTGAGPAEQIRGLNRLQGRSFTCAIHDEVGNHFDAGFIDAVQATLRGPAGVPTRTILLGNPGGPFHPVLQARYGIPAGYPEPGKASRFFSEDAQKHVVFASFTAASNQHLDIDQYIRNIKIAAADDPALLDAWLHGRLDVDIAGSYYGSSFSVRRSLRDAKPGDIRADELNRAFVCLDWGCTNPTVAYLCLPDPEDAPKGSIWLLDEFYVAASTAGGQRDWTRGTYLSNAEQAVGIIEWLSRWNLRPGTTKIVCDDAVFNATGGPKGSTAGDFRDAGCPLVRAGKMNAREANGLALIRTMLQAAGRDPETPWLLWTKVCQGLMATWPTLPRHPRDVERIADGCANHSLDAARYGVQWQRAKWKTGSAKSRMGQIY